MTLPGLCGSREERGVVVVVGAGVGRRDIVVVVAAPSTS